MNFKEDNTDFPDEEEQFDDDDEFEDEPGTDEEGI